MYKAYIWLYATWLLPPIKQGTTHRGYGSDANLTGILCLSPSFHCSIPVVITLQHSWDTALAVCRRHSSRLSLSLGCSLPTQPDVGPGEKTRDRQAMADDTERILMRPERHFCTELVVGGQLRHCPWHTVGSMVRLRGSPEQLTHFSGTVPAQSCSSMVGI